MKMFVLSAKVNTKKLLMFSLLGAVAAVALLLLANGETAAASAKGGAAGLAAQTNGQRVAYLKTFGWSVEEEACEIVEIAIPMEFGDVYENYNAVQKKQGFDLAPYRGKRVKRYTYAVLNYPGQAEDVRANLLVYNDQIIGGDVCSLKLDGFLHGFQLETRSNP